VAEEQWWSAILPDKEGGERERKGLGMGLEEMIEAIAGIGRVVAPVTGTTRSWGLGSLHWISGGGTRCVSSLLLRVCGHAMLPVLDNFSFLFFSMVF
jgi:hypothetical protein